MVRARPALCALCSVVATGAARQIGASHARHPSSADTKASVSGGGLSDWRIACALAGYALFGVGYIGYMTFIVALLRNGSMSAASVSGFYILLGVTTVVSARCGRVCSIACAALRRSRCSIRGSAR